MVGVEVLGRGKFYNFEILFRSIGLENGSKGSYLRVSIYFVLDRFFESFV